MLAEAEGPPQASGGESRKGGEGKTGKGLGIAHLGWEEEGTAGWQLGGREEPATQSKQGG